MNWSTDEKILTRQVNKAFDELGFEWPESSEQLKLFNIKFKGYPHKLTGKEIDSQKIIDECLNTPQQ